MAIDFYDSNTLSSGFAGWRVAGYIRGKRYQKYFPLRNPHPLVDDEVWREYQHLRARYYEAKMMARSAACRYIDFISKTNDRTFPCRGLGFQGMTMAILPSPGTHRYYYQFVINNQGKTQRFPIRADQSFDKAWELAMDAWVSTYDIRPKDAAMIRQLKKPTPSAFKTLRQQMNLHEGHNIPVDALHFAFAGQRENLKRKRAARPAIKPWLSTREKSAGAGDLSDFSTSLLSEIERYRSGSHRLDDL
ncbi:hypothetical protein [Marinobacter sp. M-5]|uniref:hypothetical protein n=1 Tax=Marinobacter sp. M-5 TaxID=3081089 RepID=UPI00293C2E69|nr:hypothetical protein [Marinobacter sp. M-5]MDV3504215.1 hypothetical protein [Marinobacter sp. M-5]